MNVARFAFAPALNHSLSAGDHRFGVSGYSVAMKGGLGQAPLAEPLLAFARQQAIAEKEAKWPPSPCPIFNKASILRDQHFFDVVWMVDYISVQMRDTHEDNITVVA